MKRLLLLLCLLGCARGRDVATHAGGLPTPGKEYTAAGARIIVVGIDYEYNTANILVYDEGRELWIPSEVSYGELKRRLK